MNIQEQLRLLREGVVTSDTAGYDTELVESWFIDSSDFLSESTGDSSLGHLIVEMANLIESGTADPKETLGFMAQVKANIERSKKNWDPFEGLKDLRLIGERMRATDTIKKHSIIPLIGPFIGLMKYAKHVKSLDKKDLLAYISEAEKMRGTLYNKLKKAKAQNDVGNIEYLERILKKLDLQINGFKIDMNQLGKHGV